MNACNDIFHIRLQRTGKSINQCTFKPFHIPKSVKTVKNNLFELSVLENKYFNLH